MHKGESLGAKSIAPRLRLQSIGLSQTHLGLLDFLLALASLLNLKENFTENFLGRCWTQKLAKDSQQGKNQVALTAGFTVSVSI